MATMTVRVKTTHQAPRDHAGERGESPTETLDQLVEEDQRRMFEAADASWAALRADPAAWAEWRVERALWETTLADGLQDESGVDR
jgi:hypothetical protein